MRTDALRHPAYSFTISQEDLIKFASLHQVAALPATAATLSPEEARIRAFLSPGIGTGFSFVYSSSVVTKQDKQEIRSELCIVCPGAAGSKAQEVVLPGELSIQQVVGEAGYSG